MLTMAGKFSFLNFQNTSNFTAFSGTTGWLSHSSDCGCPNYDQEAKHVSVRVILDESNQKPDLNCLLKQQRIWLSHITGSSEAGRLCDWLIQWFNKLPRTQLYLPVLCCKHSRLWIHAKMTLLLFTRVNWDHKLTFQLETFPSVFLSQVRRAHPASWPVISWEMYRGFKTRFHKEKGVTIIVTGFQITDTSSMYY
jgi:hypothetical protein